MPVGAALPPTPEGRILEQKTGFRASCTCARTRAPTARSGGGGGGGGSKGGGSKGGGSKGGGVIRPARSSRAHAAGRGEKS